MRVLVAVPVVVACVLGLGGCRGGDRAAPPAAPVVPSAVSAFAADPLAGIEAQVDAVERDVDSDAVPGR